MVHVYLFFLVRTRTPLSYVLYPVYHWYSTIGTMVLGRTMVRDPVCHNFLIGKWKMAHMCMYNYHAWYTCTWYVPWYVLEYVLEYQWYSSTRTMVPKKKLGTMVLEYVLEYHGTMVRTRVQSTQVQREH